jgi:hypothetical protein
MVAWDNLGTFFHRLVDASLKFGLQIQDLHVHKLVEGGGSA